MMRAFMNKLTKLKTFLVTTSLIASNAYADITFNGFASIRATAADADGSSSPVSTMKGNGDISFKDESLFALQAKADLTDGLTATIQLMAEGNKDFDIEARWAYLSYTLNDNHTLSAGRFANPIFFQSEYEKVGYTHNFARLPRSVYIGFEFSTIEGMALDSSFFIGDYTLETKALYGNWHGDVFSPSTQTNEQIGFENLFSLRAALSGDWWKVYAGGFVSEFDGGTLDSLLANAAAGGINAALQAGATQQDADNFLNGFLWGGKDVTYYYAGFNIDYNNFIVDFEATDYGVDGSSDAINKTWYAALGYRFDNVVVTLHQEEFEQVTGFDFLNGVQHPALIGLGKAINTSFANTDYDGTGLSMRYDFHPSAALKIDYFSGDNETPNIGEFSIWSIGVDLVF